VPSRTEHNTIRPARDAVTDGTRHNVPVSIEFSQRIRRIPVYPAADGYAQQEPLVRLASNESPYPPLPAVREAIERQLSTLNRYPDPSNSLLRQRLSDRYGVPTSRIAIGNGSCDILLAAGEALLEPGAELVYAWPSFSVYPHLTAASGARAVTVALDEHERHDLPAMLREITVATRLVLVCNPNNPTSTAVALADIAEFLAEVPPYVCVILDEAYCEFNTLDDPDSSLELLRAHPNLVLLRTFSKVHGLCGLRVGFALCGSEELPRALDQVRQPFFCNALAQAAAVEALAHQDAVEERVIRTVAERVSVDERLRALGIQPADSQANFCWFELGEHNDEQAVMQGLAERGVLVRAGTALGSQVPALRVTYGLPEENWRFIDALAEVLAPAPAR
jgi:histidinol-phosphate aminotransferase